MLVLALLKGSSISNSRQRDQAILFQFLDVDQSTCSRYTIIIQLERKYPIFFNHLAGYVESGSSDTWGVKYKRWEALLSVSRSFSLMHRHALLIEICCTKQSISGVPLQSQLWVYVPTHKATRQWSSDSDLLQIWKHEKFINCRWEFCFRRFPPRSCQYKQDLLKMKGLATVQKPCPSGQKMVAWRAVSPIRGKCPLWESSLVEASSKCEHDCSSSFVLTSNVIRCYVKDKIKMVADNWQNEACLYRGRSRGDR